MFHVHEFLDNLTSWERSLMCSSICRYGFLLPRVLSDHEDVLSICVAVFDHFGIAPEMYQVGITKLFFRAGQVIRIHISHPFIRIQICSPDNLLCDYQI